MNVLEFINSNTVRKHLKSINYKPDSLTAAFIVWQSKSHTLAEKAKAFEWIIENMPDMPIPAHENHAEKESVYSFLRGYIDLVSKYISSFENGENDAVYYFTAYYGARDNRWVADRTLYSSFDGIMAAIKADIEDEEMPKPLRIKIRRRILNTSECKNLSLLPNMEYYSLEIDDVIPDEDFEVLHLFENLCLPIPHPFKKGDIVRECAGKYALPLFYNDTLVVTDYMSEEEIKEKFSTLNIYCYTLYGICSDGEGGTYEDSINHYLNAEIIEPGEVLIKDSVLVEKSEKLKEKRND